MMKRTIGDRWKQGTVLCLLFGGDTEKTGDGSGSPPNRPLPTNRPSVSPFSLSPQDKSGCEETASCFFTPAFQFL